MFGCERSVVHAAGSTMCDGWSRPWSQIESRHSVRRSRPLALLAKPGALRLIEFSRLIGPEREFLEAIMRDRSKSTARVA